MISHEDVVLLLRLLTGYLIATFVVSPANRANDHRTKKIRSGGVYLQAVLAAVLVWLFSGHWNSVWLLPGMFLPYLGISFWKDYRPRKAAYVVAEYSLHILLILTLWLVLTDSFQHVGLWARDILMDRRILAITCGYIIVVWPLGKLIGIATERWRNEPGVNTDGLAKAGHWIGVYERFLIFTFILLDQFTAIGLLIAAKSVLRFNDKENSTQKKTEYVLIGTLMSFSSSLVTGLIVQWLIQ